ncbi:MULTISPECIES: nuclease [Streptomyces]|uniref:Nuclease n=2 Tax=Streptomyces TaxID=1883 RepID=A0A3Q9FYV0_STRLT|nr:nuclease [Streptomyces luteoverticillatus]AZQ75102.1 nuclease [Streptomyces luteoverticillatus]
MPMLLIKGNFHLSGHTRPDGDTVPFIPDYVGEWKLVQGCHKPEPAADGHVDVRLEGIDALETHYSGNYGTEERQPRKFADAATDAMLTWLGFTDIRRTLDLQTGHETISATPDRVPGYILTRGSDVFGRCVALVVPGPPVGASGYEIDVRATLLEKTANQHLLAEGLAYPTFYSGFPAELRRAMTAAALTAKADPGKGIWNITSDTLGDVTLTGAKVTGMASITDNGAVILPKLFRRLKEYLSLGNTSLACFPAYLGGAADKFRVLSADHESKLITGLHNVVEITNGETVKMTHPSEELLFDEK